MIDAAAKRRQPATVLLLTATGLQTSDPTQIPADHLFHARPGERRQVVDLDLVPRVRRLGAEREQPVRDLMKVGIEIALAIVARRTVAIRDLGLARLAELPRRWIEQRDAHDAQCTGKARRSPTKVITRDHTAIRGVAPRAPRELDFVAERDGPSALFPQQNRNYSAVRDGCRNPAVSLR